ncbi:MAG: hypothetical protein KAV87_59230, partial [Desulfobacteraceae bacterium]|nr:hypothetical protein [Desulfobacteraceae bacterium]
EFRIIKKGTVIGVVEDFHFESLHQEIKPVALYIYPEMFAYLSVRISSNGVSRALHFLKNKWEELTPEQTFEYSFLDEDFNNLYKADMRLSKIFGYVSLFAIFIACLGLLGLAAFTVKQRTKEIAIRKILGASIQGIIILLSKEFSKWVLVSNIIAWPIAYFIMNNWLQNYAYRINIGIWTFFLSGILVLVIVLLSVSFQAIRSALANPVEALRYE